MTTEELKQLADLSDEVIKLKAKIIKIRSSRYSLYERKDLNSKILWNGTNKAEMKKVKTGWKYQILLTTITAEIYDNVKKEWVA